MRRCAQGETGSLADQGTPVDLLGKYPSYCGILPSLV